MNKIHILCVVAGLSVVLGCDRDEDMTPQPVSPSTPAPSTSPTGVPVADGSMSLTAEDARQRAAAAEQAGANVRDATGQGITGAQSAVSGAQTQATAAAKMTADEAKTMLDQAMTYVKENKYDLAEKTLNSVEANKASLPKALQDQLSTVRTALTTAKAGGGLPIPGLGGLNK